MKNSIWRACDQRWNSIQEQFHNQSHCFSPSACKQEARGAPDDVTPSVTEPDLRFFQLYNGIDNLPLQLKHKQLFIMRCHRIFVHHIKWMFLQTFVRSGIKRRILVWRWRMFNFGVNTHKAVRAGDKHQKRHKRAQTDSHRQLMLKSERMNSIKSNKAFQWPALQRQISR